MKFVLLTIGRCKFPFVEDGLRHYLENIRHFTEVELIELKDVESRREREAELFADALKRRKLLDGRSTAVLLDEKGKTYSSEAFARWLGTLRDQGTQRMIFLIGGAYGFSEEMRASYPLLSLSSMTFPHDLARLLLAEQIYRGLHILSGGKYHHGG